MNVRLSFLSIAFLCGAAAGCKKVGAAAGEADKGAPKADPDRVLDLYVQCFNEVDHRVHDSWRSYAKWVDMKKGLTGKEATIDGIDQIDDYQSKKCIEALGKAIAGDAATGPLAEPSKNYLATLTKLLPIVGTTKTYYEHKDYKDDAFAKGKTLHADLVAAFQAWDKADEAMRNMWDQRHRAARDQHLAQLEKDQGRKSVLFTTAQVMNAGEGMVEAIDTPAALAPAIAKYQAAYDELDAFFGGPALTASTNTDRYMFRQCAEWLLVQTKEAGRLLKAGKPLPETGDGSAQSLIKKYNDLVERSNQITWK